MYPKCRVIREENTEIAQLIVEYVEKHRDITVAKDRWLHLIP